ncbi:Organic cation/carnitine transporter 7 [Armadillidium nasatum]|uniref:Organic cation/carnitine transporter 7 n=1 Tax=Armadillidium nasatum TaxID=96803 RepID=A0A5N5SHP7_9CRUS|nr:Organic cation/carnitine transporter 7 [Armadillidium nasatum]
MLFIISLSQLISALHNVGAVYLSAPFEYSCDLQIPTENSEVKNYIKTLTHYPPGFSSCTYKNHNYSAIESLLLETPQTDWFKIDLTEHLSNQSVSCEIFEYKMGSCMLKEAPQFISASLVYERNSNWFSFIWSNIRQVQLGRRKSMLSCVILLLITSISVAFVRSYLAFIFLRFCVALLVSGLMVINFVLLMEITRPEVRSFTGMMNGIPFGLGITLVSCFAYFLRDWRSLQLALGIFGGILLIFFWVLPESPRWLASKGRPQEALEILKTIAKWNKKVLPSDVEMILLLTEPTESSERKSLLNKCSHVCEDQIKLFRTPVIRKRTLIGFFSWFVAAMVYYGLIFSGANLKADPFLMVFISGLIEVPSFIITAFFLHKFWKKACLAVLFIICSLMLFIIMAIPREQLLVTFILANLGKFFNTSVFQLCFLYTSEMMPTTIRNVAVGTSSMIARGEIHYSLPSTVFGVLSLAAGLLALLLPETLNKTLPQTIEEVEGKKS